MRRRRPWAGTAALLVFGAVGCATGPSAVPAADSPPPVTPAGAPDPGPPPAPQVLAGVMARLADPAVPGADKLALVADSTPSEAVALDRFAAALRDGGYVPVTFAASDVGWTGPPPTVRATITVSTTNPADPGVFSFPMEFLPAPGGWQLTRDTAETLLDLRDAAPR